MSRTEPQTGVARGNPTLKLLDRYLGIPLAFVAGLRPKRRLPPQVRRIGLMKTAAIGDTLLLAGLIGDVRDAYPAATITLVTGSDNRGVGALIDPTDDQVLVSPKAPVASVRTLRSLDLDVLVDFGSWPRFDALLAALSNARFTVGFATAGQHRHFVYDTTVRHSRLEHERDNYARLLAAIGVTARRATEVRRPGLLSPDRLPRRPFVVFHPWSAGYLREIKEWSIDRWVELATRLVQSGCTIALTGGPGDVSRSAELQQALRGVGIEAVDLAGAMSLGELADFLAASAGVVCVNTGIAHLAGLVGAPTVSLEGPTPPVRWRPLGPRVRPVASAYPGCGYLNLGFEYAGQRTDCMAGITVDAVLAALEEVRGENAPISDA